MDISRQQITFQNEQTEIYAYATYPQRPGPHPAVVVIPPIMGISDYLKNVTDQLAREGFAGFAVDFFSREGQPDVSTPENIVKAVASLPDQRVIGDVVAAINYLKKQESVNSDAIGVMGFCIGGAYSYMTACESEDVKAAVNFYGTVIYRSLSDNKPVSPISLVNQLKAPLLNHYGDNDHLIPIEDVETFRNSLRDTGKTFEFFIYGGAPHAFHDLSRPGYRPVAAAEAWHRTIQFFNWYLK